MKVESQTQNPHLFLQGPVNDSLWMRIYSFDYFFLSSKLSDIK